MKASDITQGARYVVQVTIPAGPRTPRIRTTQQATVVGIERSTVTVEALEPVCVNLDDFPHNQQALAMGTGRLRYEHRPVRRQVRTADIMGPAAEASA